MNNQLKNKLINEGYSLSLLNLYKFGAIIRNNTHQDKIIKPIKELRIKLLNNFQIETITKTPKLIIDQG